MLGAEIFEYCTEHSSKYEIVPLARFNVDVTDETKLYSILALHEPDIVINATGFTNVDAAEDEEKHDEVFALNVKAPESMAYWCFENNVSFFHISTDYVFSGKKGDVFTEDAPVNPINIYGKSKAEGEHAVMKYANSCIVRTAWLAGKHGHNFVNQMVHLSKNEPSITIIKNEWGNPSFTFDVARAIVSLCEDSKKWHGKIVHAVNEGVVSRKELLSEIQTYLDLPTEIIEVNEYPVSAKRPESSVLQNTLLPPLPKWKDSLHKFLLPEKEKLEEKRRKKFGKHYKG